MNLQEPASDEKWKQELQMCICFTAPHHQTEEKAFSKKSEQLVK